MRPSTAQQRFACQTINTYTGLSLPTGWEDDFYICHAYIGMYYDHAKYIRDTHPIQRADWQEPSPPVPYDAVRYAQLHEAIDDNTIISEHINASPTADPLQRPVNPAQLRAIQFIREQLGLIPPLSVTQYHMDATAFINAYYQDARNMQHTHGSIYNSSHPNHGAALIARQEYDPRQPLSAMNNTISREELERILQSVTTMPTGLEYEAPEPSATTLRRWGNPGFSQPQIINEFAFEPDDTPSEETLKDLIARQFNAR